MMWIKNGEMGGREWHIGEPVPAGIHRVVTVQLDGDELDLLLDAMYVSAGKHPIVDHRKHMGFHLKEKDQ
jgi:hypothetical protein